MAEQQPLTYRFGYYQLPLEASIAAADGLLSNTEVQRLATGQLPGAVFVPLQSAFTASAAAGGVLFKVQDEVRSLLLQDPDASAAVVLSVSVRDQLGAETESIFTSAGRPAVVRLVGPAAGLDESQAAAALANATADAQDGLQSLGDDVSELES